MFHGQVTMFHPSFFFRPWHRGGQEYHPPRQKSPALPDCRRSLGAAASLRSRDVEDNNQVTFNLSWVSDGLLYGYGSIPIDPIFSGMNIHKPGHF